MTRPERPFRFLTAPIQLIERPVPNYRHTEAQLEKDGFRFYQLNGLSLAQMDERRLPFDRPFHRFYPIADTRSLRGEVAILPGVVLEGSNRLPLSQQLAKLEAFDQEVRHKYPGYTALMGNAADYAELNFAYYAQTKRHLLGEGIYARTQTVTKQTADQPMVAEVGNFTYAGLDVDHWFAESGPLGRTYVVPLLVRDRDPIEPPEQRENL